MNLTILFLLLIIALIVFAIIYKDLQDQKLLETVTKSHRGTRTERQMVLMLLKSGIPHQTIFHDLYLKKQGENYCQIDPIARICNPCQLSSAHFRKQIIKRTNRY
jgi:hypothetical protein